MAEQNDNPARYPAGAILHGARSYWKDSGQPALIGAGFACLGATGFFVGAAAGLFIGGLGLPLQYLSQ